MYIQVADKINYLIKKTMPQNFFMVLMASVIPFGTFVVEKKLNITIQK